MAKTHFTVYYDGSCASCVEDRARYEIWLGKHIDQVSWFDITDQNAYLIDRGIDPARALRELHVEDAEGVIHRELDAYILLLQQIWWLRPLAWVIALPFIRRRLSQWYRRQVDSRLARDGRG
ncbi:DCC1-like thiol-disulfide oxidoreductase family protein [Photobacterium alginatilyticum]|uniref:DCC1-like thiol-disulfide oxidoreductase family protein n=1 Tax=Photobacterium alginatilyticum TaxID=1775171 RepID=UPI004067A69C